MHTIIIKDNNEKALFYADYYKTGNSYGIFAAFGGVMAFLVLFIELPDYTLIFTPIIGYFFAYFSINLNLYLLTRRPDVYAQRFEWQESLRFSTICFWGEPYAVAPKKINLLSKEGLKLYWVFSKSMT